jgi:hypothetical protein
VVEDVTRSSGTTPSSTRRSSATAPWKSSARRPREVGQGVVVAHVKWRMVGHEVGGPQQNGIDSSCRSCHAKAAREWRAKNREYVDAYNARRRADAEAAGCARLRPGVPAPTKERPASMPTRRRCSVTTAAYNEVDLPASPQHRESRRLLRDHATPLDGSRVGAANPSDSAIGTRDRPLRRR